MSSKRPQQTNEDSGFAGDDSETVRLSPEDDELFKETVRVSVAKSATLAQQSADADNVATRLLPVEDEAETRLAAPSDEDFDEDDEPSAEPPENALKPSKIRFALVCLLFVFVAVWAVINIEQVFLTQTESDWWVSWENGHYVVKSVGSSLSEKLQIGDEIVSIDEQPITTRAAIREIEYWIQPNQPYTLQVRRAGQTLNVETVAQPLPFPTRLARYFFGIVAPIIFLLIAAGVFLLKSNDKTAVLNAIFYSLLAMGDIVPKPTYFYVELPSFLEIWWRSGLVLYQPASAVLLHFLLVFPNRSSILRRFPQLEWLIYVPMLLVFVPYAICNQLSYAGFREFDFVSVSPFFYVLTSVLASVYLLSALAALTADYFRADETDKRRVRLLAVGIALALIPFLVNYAIFEPLEYNLKMRFLDFGAWRPFVFYSLAVFVPFLFGYAVVRHKVIPVSFIVRRGLQYLLATNALRLALILPIVGIVWNIWANPARRLDEILLQNTLGFYLCGLLLLMLVLLNQFGLREWVDRLFFREQFNQERVLRDLTEAVKTSDSLGKLSQLVCDQIEAALHPQSVYLFFRDDAQNSTFALNYATNPTTAKLKFGADSAVLRFLQTAAGAVDFPSDETAALPRQEKSWLRKLAVNLLVPCQGIDGKLAGFFSLGEKKSEIPYTGRDRELLETLANQIALVHENLNLKDRVLQEQKIKTEVLSRFDAGDINLLKECPRCRRCYDRADAVCEDDGAELVLSLPVERTIESRYRLEKLIGKGGMGAVYKATDLRLNRQVAVKILSGAMFGDSESLRRFEREAQVSARLNHPNAITIYDYGSLSTEGAFLVMEILSGESMKDVLERQETLGLPQAVFWFGQILDGIEAAHKAGIVHRDMKPDNVFITRNEQGAERLCILDFGIARLNQANEAAAAANNVTLPGTVIGTFGYMPFEQLNGEQTDARSDLFAVGVMIYEALHGVKPYRGRNYIEYLTVMSQEVKLDENDPLREFFQRALARDAKNRFQTAGEMKAALLAVHAGLTF